MDWRRSPLAATTLSSSSSGPTYLCFSSQVPWLPWKWVEEPITVVQWIVINYVWVFVMWVAFIIWKYVFVFLCVLLLCGGCTWSVCCAQYSLLESTIAVWRFALRRVHPLLVPSLPPPPLIHHTDHPHQVTTHDQKIITPLAMMMKMQNCMINDHYGVEENSVSGNQIRMIFFQTRLGTSLLQIMDFSFNRLTLLTRHLLW